MTAARSSNNRGKNYDKNRRKARSRKLEALKAAKKQWKIRTDPDIRRTLRKNPRDSFRKAVDENYIHPWVRENPAYRFTDRPHSAASLLGLPSEIRQKILLQSFPQPERRASAVDYFAKGKREARWASLYARIGQLCTVSQIIRVDMKWVGAEWKKQLKQEEDSKSRGLPTSRMEMDLNRLRLLARTMGQTGKGRVVTMQFRRKSSKKNRPPKCWYCEDRHYHDLRCPMEKTDPKKWYELTKVAKGRSKRLGKAPGVASRKIVFED